MDLLQALDDWCDWHEQRNHSERTRAWYTQKVRMFHAWLVRNDRSTRVDRITLADARQFVLAEQRRKTTYDAHAKRKQQHRPLSDRTIDGYVRTIKALWAWLLTEEIIDANPMKRLQRPKLEERYQPIMVGNEIDRLLRACDVHTFLGSRMYAIIAIFYDSGLRAGELCNIDLADLDMDARLIHVTKSKTKRQRFAPFSLDTKKAIRRYLRHRATFVGDVNCDAVFVDKRRGRLNVAALQQAIKRHAVAAGVPRAHCHLFRHSAAVASLLNGASQFEVKRLLGHASLSTTDQYMALVQQLLQQQHQTFSPMAALDRDKRRR